MKPLRTHPTRPLHSARSRRLTLSLCIWALLFTLATPSWAQDPQTDPTALSESRQVAGWTLVGGGALFILGGFAAGLRVNDFDERIGNLEEAELGADSQDEDKIDELQEERDLMAFVRGTGFIGGLGLLIGGATVLVYDASVTNGETAMDLRLSPWTSPQSQGLMLEGRF